MSYNLENTFKKMHEATIIQASFSIKKSRKRCRRKTIKKDIVSKMETEENKFRSKTEILWLVKCEKKLFLATFKKMFNDGFFSLFDTRNKGVRGNPKKYRLSDAYFKDLKRKLGVGGIRDFTIA